MCLPPVRSVCLPYDDDDDDDDDHYDDDDDDDDDDQDGDHNDDRDDNHDDRKDEGNHSENVNVDRFDLYINLKRVQVIKAHPCWRQA